MIDNYLADIERIRNDGGVLIIKWDGERAELRQTVVLTRPGTAYLWRKDCDDVSLALQDAIKHYKSTFLD